MVDTIPPASLLLAPRTAHSGGMASTIPPVQEDATIDCPWCGEPIELELDVSAGRSQRYVEDCSVCCRPCVISVRFNEGGEARLEVDQE